MTTSEEFCTSDEKRASLCWRSRSSVSAALSSASATCDDERFERVAGRRGAACRRCRRRAAPLSSARRKSGIVEHERRRRRGSRTAPTICGTSSCRSDGARARSCMFAQRRCATSAPTTPSPSSEAATTAKRSRPVRRAATRRRARPSVRQRAHRVHRGAVDALAVRGGDEHAPAVRSAFSRPNDSSSLCTRPAMRITTSMNRIVVETVMIQRSLLLAAQRAGWCARSAPSATRRRAG